MVNLLRKRAFILFLCDLFAISGLVVLGFGLFLWLGKPLALTILGCVLFFIGLSGAFYLRPRPKEMTKG